MYASEWLILEKGDLQELEKQSRKILRKNEELYKYTENITDTTRKGRLKLYRHIVRMDENRLTKKIFMYIMGLEATSKWAEEVSRSWHYSADDSNGSQFRGRVDTFKTFEEKPIKKNPTR